MISLLDYVLDYDDNFWIVGSIEDNKPKGYIVYRVDSLGDRFNNITLKYYKKMMCKSLDDIPEYKRIFKPKEFYIRNKDKLTGVWKEYVDALNNSGIDDENIGIFGSYLVGFDIIKDVDFIIYGIDNLYKYYNNNDYIKDYIRASYISDEHIKYQYDKHKNNYDKRTDLYKIISRNWSGVQIKKGVLSTPRFIDESYVNIHPDDGKRSVIRCEVIEGLTSACLPRRAKVLYNNQEYTILSPLWKYQSFLCNGDIIECLGSVNDCTKTITLYDKDCYIRYIN